METLVIPAAKLGYAFVKIFAVTPPLAMTLGAIGAIGYAIYEGCGKK